MTKKQVKELKETASLMESKDYKARFRAEYYQLKIRRDKLHILLNQYYCNQLDFELSVPPQLLEKQLGVMDNYLDILEIRAWIEKIEL